MLTTELRILALLCHGERDTAEIEDILSDLRPITVRRALVRLRKQSKVVKVREVKRDPHTPGRAMHVYGIADGVERDVLRAMEELRALKGDL